MEIGKFPYPRPQAVKFKIRGYVPYPKNALATAYDIFRDIEPVNEAHRAKKSPPFAIKEFDSHGFSIISYLPLPANMVSDRLKAKKLFVYKGPIYLPQDDIPYLYPLKQITITFRTPTAFKYGTNYVPEFYAPVFIKSVLQSYGQIIPGTPELSVADILRYIEFSDMDLKKEGYVLQKGLAMQGFTGTVKLRFAKSAVPDLKLLILYILEAASICGVGIKKAWGMGDINIVA